MWVQHRDMELQEKCSRNGRNIQKQNTKMLQYVKRVQNSATILVKMRLAFPPVLLYHKNNDRERKQHPDI
jgi:hypothetical protein